MPTASGRQATVLVEAMQELSVAASRFRIRPVICRHNQGALKLLQGHGSCHVPVGVSRLQDSVLLMACHMWRARRGFWRTSLALGREIRVSTLSCFGYGATAHYNDERPFVAAFSLHLYAVKLSKKMCWGFRAAT